MEFRKLRGMESRPTADTVRGLPCRPAALPSPWATADPLLSRRLAYSPLETSGAAVLGQGPSGWEGGWATCGDHPRLIPVRPQEAPVGVR